jgi:ABC-type uncharacterized transport system permease subunit
MQHEIALIRRGVGLRTIKVEVPRAVVIALVSLAIFALLLLAAGKDPLKAYQDTLLYVFTNRYGFSELLVRMTPLC